MTTVLRRPLTSRPLDLLYFSFVLMHIPATLFIDLQALYPQSIVPAALQKFIPFYIDMSGDPLIAGVFRNDLSFVWFRSFLWVEFLFQLPVFILSARGLWKDSPSIYLLLLIYGASTATTVLPCIFTILAVPTVTSAQRLMLLSSYIPFFLIPLGMTLDMALRLSSALNYERRIHAGADTRVKREE